MNKHDVIALWGSMAKLADDYECSTQNISKWPDELPLRIADRIRGVALRKGIELPPDMLEHKPAEAA